MASFMTDLLTNAKSSSAEFIENSRQKADAAVNRVSESFENFRQKSVQLTHAVGNISNLVPWPNKMSNFDWGYDPHNGPDVWPDHFPAAKGDCQSPIDIQACAVLSDTSLHGKAVVCRYSICTEMVNTGHTFNVQHAAADHDFAGTIHGGPLTGSYKFVHMHAHWGEDDSCGSEHMYNGRSYPCELHILHYNSDRHSDLKSALGKPDGICVLAVFLELVDEDNAKLQPLLDGLNQLREAGSKIELSTGIDVNSLLPNDTGKYWTYSGSLTAPPCTESVVWVVFSCPVKIGFQQMKTLRAALHDAHGGQITKNNRPTMPLNSRPINASF